ncbi:SMI1/KNR4 family protein [Myxococcota bacterium]|nr:SMI1/KNR4 family protein [Myxococcota bacterium]
MTEDVWSKLADRATQFPMMFGSGASAEEIADAESELGCKFDFSYVRFLREYGGAMVGADPVLGLRQADVMGDDLWSVIETTQRFRTDQWAGVSGWYVVCVDGVGNPIGVDVSGAVHVSDHHGGGVQKLTDTFEEYLSTLL